MSRRWRVWCEVTRKGTFDRILGQYFGIKDLKYGMAKRRRFQDIRVASILITVFCRSLGSQLNRGRQHLISGTQSCARCVRSSAQRRPLFRKGPSGQNSNRRLAENGELGKALNARIGSKYSSHYGLRIDPTRAKNDSFITGTKDLGKKGTLLVGSIWHPYYKLGRSNYEVVTSYWCHFGCKWSNDFPFRGSASRHDTAASATIRP
jgi:hypothetical protein